MDQRSFHKAISRLPSPSPVLRQICSVVDNPESSAGQIAQALQLDPAISSKVLRLANSAYIGIPGTVSSLQNAVVLLGIKRIHSLVLATGLLASMRAPADLSFPIVRYWRHSISAALIAESIARHLKRYDIIDEHEVFAGAVLHDIGKLILGMCRGDVLEQVIKKSKEEHVPFFIAESDEDNLSHTKMGELLATQWCFPESLYACIGGHHAPGRYREAGRAVSIVHVADIMAHLVGFSIYPEELVPRIEDAVLGSIQLPPERLRVIAEAAIMDQRRVETLLEIFEN